MGGFCPGGFCPGGFCPRGDFVQGDFVRGILSGGFCPGGFCPRTIILSPPPAAYILRNQRSLNIHLRKKSKLLKNVRKCDGWFLF